MKDALQELFEHHEEFWADKDCPAAAARLVSAKACIDAGVDIKAKLILERLNGLEKDYLWGAENNRPRSIGGQTTAEIRKDERYRRAEEAAQMWDSLATKSPRNRAGIIAERMGLATATVREYLRLTGRKP